MNFVGKSVWMKWTENNLRFGNVIEQKTCNNWVFVKVDWVGDTAFESHRQDIIRLRGYDKYSDWYRIDKVSLFDKESLIEKINKL